MLVYHRAPGDVVRCPACGVVVMVIVSTPAGLRITFEAMRWLELETT
jgi:hypothetical protein